MNAEAVTMSTLAYAARRIVHSLLGCEPVQVERIRAGVMTFKFVVDTPRSGAFVVRFYPRINAGAVEYEPDLVRRLNAADLPVPRVVGDSRFGPSSPLSYMVYEMIPGVTLRRCLPSLEPLGRRRIARQVSEFLMALQDVNVEGYGDLLSATTARFNSLLGFIETSFAEGISTAQSHGSLPKELIADLEGIRGRLGLLDLAPPCGLAWGDMLTDNILVREEGSLAGFIDFEGTLAADPLLNLGYCYAAYGPSGFFKDLSDAWSGPLTAGHVDRVLLYAVLRGVRIAKFAHQPLPTGYQREPVEKAFPGFAMAVQSLMGRLVHGSSATANRPEV
jgi:hypothetical protein